MVEGENEVCTEFFLDLHGYFWGEAMFGLVNVGGEGDSLFVDLTEAVIEAEYLEAAGVGEYRFMPGHEFLEFAKLMNDVCSGS